MARHRNARLPRELFSGTRTYRLCGLCGEPKDACLCTPAKVQANQYEQLKPGAVGALRSYEVSAIRRSGSLDMTEL